MTAYVCPLDTADDVSASHEHCPLHGCVEYRCCVASSPLRVWLSRRDFRTAYAVLPSDSLGRVSVRRIAEHCGATYLAAAERAREFCESGAASLFGSVTDTCVRLGDVEPVADYPNDVEVLAFYSD